ncbi:hypothetical protein V493_02322, partial [Pseudogymnoascus sp. VKM F-4281 (FW-2241)]
MPFLFSSAHLLAKNPATGEHSPWNHIHLRWIDGSVDNDLLMTSLAEMFNVNHFIVSQVNPYVVPFLSSSAPSLSSAPSVFRLNSYFDPILAPLTELAKSEALQGLHVLAQLGILPNVCNKSAACCPRSTRATSPSYLALYRDFIGMLKNPTPEFM